MVSEAAVAMVYRQTVVLFLFLTSAACVLQASFAHGKEFERPAFAHEQSDLPVDARIIYGELENGLRYAVRHNDTPPGTASMRLRFAVGSLDESPEVRGIAHYLEHMAFNGSENVPEGELLPRLERFGLSFGADTNAHTGFDETVYKLNLPNVDDAVIDEAFMLFRETADKLTLDQGAIDRERGIILSEKRTRNTTPFKLLLAQIEFFASGSGLLEQLPIGTEETINSINAEQMRAFYEAHYHPEKAFLVFVGDVDPDSVIERIEATFGDWRPGTQPAPIAEAAAAVIEPGKVSYHHDPETMLSIVLANLMPYEEQADTAERRRTRLVSGMGDLMLSHRLRKLSEKADSVLLRGSATSNDYSGVASYASVRLGSQPEDWAEAIAAAEKELRRALEYGFTQAEFDRQLARVRTSREARAERSGTQPTHGRFGNGIVDQIVSSYGNQRVVMHADDRLALFNRFSDSMTLDEVNAAFRERWNDGEALSTFVASSEPIDKVVEETRAAIEQSRQTEVEPYEESVTTVAFEPLGEPGETVARITDDAMDVHYVTFANNVRLNVKSTDFADKQVQVVVRVGDGALSLPRKDEGLRRFALNLLMHGGVEEFESLDLATYASQQGFRLRLFFDRDSDSILLSGAGKSDALEPLLRLLAEYAVRPGLRRDAGERYKKKMRAWYDTHDSTPTGVASKEVPRLVRSGDRRFGFDDLDNFLAASHEEAEPWLRSQLTNGAIEMTVVGDATFDEIESAVAATFGALPERPGKRGKYPEMEKLEFPGDLREVVTYWHEGEADQALLQMFWSGPDALDPEVAAHMRVLRAIVQHRMVSEIREDAAVTYSPGVAVHGDDVAEGYGYLRVSLEVPPEVVDATQQRIADVAAAMGAGNISEDDLARAITPILEDLDDSRHSNAYWIRVLQDAQSERRGIEQHLAWEKTLRATTLEEIRALAGEVLAAGSDSVVVQILHSDLKPAANASSLSLTSDAR